MDVLLVEDDAEFGSWLRSALEEAGHSVVLASDGVEGIRYARSRSSSFDVIVADRMMPKLDGLGMISELRSLGIETPVLVLSALGQVDDRVMGLRSGGDDYLTKPCAIPELLARLEVLSRRHIRPADIIESGGLRLDRMSRTVQRSGRKIDMQPREYKLLEFLVLNEGRVVTRSMLLQKIWDLHFDPGTNVIDVHISRLRQKLRLTSSNEDLIETVRGIGYRFVDSGSIASTNN